MYVPPHLRGGQQPQPQPQPQPQLKPKKKPMPLELVQAVTQWILDGCACAEIKILQRPSAIKYPNTFVILWKDVNLPVLGHVEYIALDLHFEGSSIQQGQNLKALGGLWIKGQEGGHNPEQDGNICNALKLIVPNISPNPGTLEKFGFY